MEIDDLLEKVDIVEIASMFTDLEEKNGEYWGISPITFPQENTPSFSVRRESGRFYDFSSGVGGTAITLVQYCMHKSKYEAIEWLKQYVGYEESSEAPRTSRMSATLTCKKYAKPKRAEKESKITILPDDYMLRYEKREDKFAVWESEGISKESLGKFQVMYDAFSDRLVYPIMNLDGKIVNVGGRSLDPEWKEKGLRKYCYFYPWGKLDLIYGLYENYESIINAGEIILFEGCKSVLLADTYGIHNAGALLTSHLNPRQMKVLAKLGVRVVFALDKDVDISKDHNIEKLKRYVYVEYVWDKNGILEAKDSPIDKGLDAFREVYNNRLRLR